MVTKETLLHESQNIVHAHESHEIQRVFFAMYYRTPFHVLQLFRVRVTISKPVTGGMLQLVVLLASSPTTTRRKEPTL